MCLFFYENYIKRSHYCEIYELGYVLIKIIKVESKDNSDLNDNITL